MFDQNENLEKKLDFDVTFYDLMVWLNQYASTVWVVAAVADSLQVADKLFLSVNGSIPNKAQLITNY